MSEFNSNYYEAAGGDIRTYMNKVFSTMALGLGVTAAVAFFGFYSMIYGGIIYKLFMTVPFFSIILVIAEFGIVFSLSSGLTRLSPSACRGLFLAYSAITGLTFSVLPLAYGLGNVFVAFLFAAVLFVCMSIIGHTTNVDLSRFSGLMMGGLLALVVVSILSIFIPALRESMMIGYLGLILFLGLTAWDIQRIKRFYYAGYGDMRENMAIYGAFQLYLDFINIFLYVVRILGNSRNNRR